MNAVQTTNVMHPQRHPTTRPRAIDQPGRTRSRRAGQRVAGGRHRDKLSRMPESDEKADLLHYLQLAREALVWKLDGLSEYDVRRPIVPTGTNLLGLIKHSASIELGYFG